MIFKSIMKIIQVNVILNKKNKVKIFQTKNMLMNMNMITMRKYSAKEIISNRMFSDKIKDIHITILWA